MRLKVRSLVGLLPLCASTVFPGSLAERFPRLNEMIALFRKRHPELAIELVQDPATKEPAPELATAVAELKTGGVDIIRNVNADLIKELRAHPQTRISTSPILRVHYIALDMRHPPFDKKAVRQAANYAIDKQAVITKMMAGLGKQVATVVQPQSFGHDASVQPYPYDPKKAKEFGPGVPKDSGTIYLGAADEAMYWVKAHGKNGIHGS